MKIDGANDVTSSRGEARTNDQTNVPISNLEVPRHDKRNDVPDCNKEFLKPVTAESAACLSNQGMKTKVVQKNLLL